MSQDAVDDYFEPVFVEFQCSSCHYQQATLFYKVVSLPRLVCQVCVYSSQNIQLTTKRLKDGQDHWSVTQQCLLLHMSGSGLNWTLVWFISHVDSQVSGQIWRPTKCFLTHMTYFTPLCTLLFTARWHDVVNRSLQTIHSNSFSPEWLFMCTASSLLQHQHLPNSLHLYLSAWMFNCSCGNTSHFNAKKTLLTLSIWKIQVLTSEWVVA